MSGSDQAAQNPWLKAKARASSGHRESLEISGIITRCFVKAAVPHEPLLGPIGQGVMAAANAAGTRGRIRLQRAGSLAFPLAASLARTHDVQRGRASPRCAPDE